MTTEPINVEDVVARANAEFDELRRQRDNYMHAASDWMAKALASQQQLAEAVEVLRALSLRKCSCGPDDLHTLCPSCYVRAAVLSITKPQDSDT